MRRFPHRLVLLACTLLTLAGTASAVEWLLIGARQRGMGGAGVATAEECSAVYWNPASLSAETNWSVGLDVNTSIELAPETLDQLKTLVETIEDLENTYTDLQDSFDRLSDADPTAATDEDLAKVLDLVLNHFSHLDRKDLGLLYDLGVNVNVQAGTFGVSVGGVGYFDTGLVADLGKLALSAVPDDAWTNLQNALEGVDLSSVPAVDYTGTGLETLSADLQDIMVSDGGIVASDAAPMVAGLLYVSSYTSDPADPDYDPSLTNPLESQLGPLGITTEFGNADLSDPEVQSMLTNIVKATVLAGQPGYSLIEENETGVHLRGAGVVEVAIAKSFPIPPIKDRLKIGAAVKMLMARTFNIDVTYTEYSDVTDVESAMGDLTDEIQTQFVDDPLDTTQLGIDLGVDFKLNKFIRLGMTMKNVNKPEFDLPNTSEKFVLDPQVRMGVAVYPLPWLCTTMDVDLSENRSQIATDYGMRFYSLGVEATLVKVLQLRAGMYGNLLAPETTPALALGFGVKMGSVFKLDLAVNGDLGKLFSLAEGGDLEVEDFPERAGASVSMQFHTKF